MRGQSQTKRIIFAALLLFGSLAASALALEAVLGTTLLDKTDNPRPVYIPQKLKDKNFAINRANHEVAKRNPHYFNDIPRALDKKPDTLRVAVLGDSFIWGDGVPYDEVWSHKLEKMLCARYGNVEVLTWGRNGWDTANELRFLKRHGFAYGPDAVIVGLVANDIRAGFHPDLVFGWEDSVCARAAKAILPRTADFLLAHVRRFYEQYVDRRFDYDTCLDALYSPANLEAYQETLQSFKSACDARGTALLFVYTPERAARPYGGYFEKIAPLLRESGIEYLNLYPVVAARFARENPRSLWANPANPHPGPCLTSLYADQVFAYITREGALGKLLQKARHGAGCAYVSGREARTYGSGIEGISGGLDLPERAHIVMQQLAYEPENQALLKEITGLRAVAGQGG